jgi:hypothetical protein
MNTPHPNQNTDQIIDSALHQLGSVNPESGMNDRILRRIRQAAAEPAPSPSPISFGWPRLALAWPRLVFGGLAGCCLCAAVVFGSIQHTNSVAAQNRPVLPVLHQQSGVATASSTHIAAHPPVAPKGGGRSDQHPGQGRAIVKPGTHVHGGDGITVPPPIH